jgi:hypothetical protein
MQTKHQYYLAKLSTRILLDRMVPEYLECFASVLLALVRHRR